MSASARSLRVIHGGPEDAAFNMALDEAISEFVRLGPSPPTLRLYGWTVPSVSIGRFQRAGDLDLSFCSAEGVPVVRRPTGGRAILHGDELTYSFSAPAGFPGTGDGVYGSYKTLSRAFVLAFERLGLHAAREMRSSGSVRSGNPLCFCSASFGELTIGGRKVIGSAQRRWPDGFMQQGSIPVRLDLGSMQRVFDTGKGLEDKMAGLAEIDGSVTLPKLREAVVEGFLEALGLEAALGDPEGPEIRRAHALVRDRYGLPEWTLAR